MIRKQIQGKDGTTAAEIQVDVGQNKIYLLKGQSHMKKPPGYVYKMAGNGEYRSGDYYSEYENCHRMVHFGYEPEVVALLPDGGYVMMTDVIRREVTRPNVEMFEVNNTSTTASACLDASSQRGHQGFGQNRCKPM